MFFVFAPVIYNRFTQSDARSFPSSESSLYIVGRLTFGIMLSSIILFFEKYCMQLVCVFKYQQSQCGRDLTFIFDPWLNIVLTSSMNAVTQVRPDQGPSLLLSINLPFIDRIAQQKHILECLVNHDH
jgi:hypothetical protein